jgi:hypothetical protein
VHASLGIWRQVATAKPMTEAQRSRFERLQAQHPDAPLYSDLGFLLNLVRQLDNEVQREPVPEPLRQRIGIIGRSHIVAATIASMRAHPHYQPEAMDLIAIPTKEIVHIERGRPLPTITGSAYITQDRNLFKPVCNEGLPWAGAPDKITLHFRARSVVPDLPHKEFPKPHFNGYMNKRRRKGR